jgi:hypothetical protein
LHLATPRRAFLSNVFGESYSIGGIVQITRPRLIEIPRLLPFLVRRNGRLRHDSAIGVGAHGVGGFSSGSGYAIMQRMTIRNATASLHHHHGRPLLRRGSFRI